ncbi:MAG: tRNA (guanosine(37)-N1)-methyltransferase TrmD [Desulfovibrio sp.]
MQFNIITIFPEFFDSPSTVGLLGKAIDAEKVKINCITPRTFTTDRHQTVDDKPYGGGAGLVMMVDPLSQALRSIEKPGRILMLSPRGRKLDQEYAAELSNEENITLMCGRYEGMDERLHDMFPIEPVCVGDFVLNGGESAALCVVESVSRLLPDFMQKEVSFQEESFASGLLEYPHYTRPDNFEDNAIPEVLASGHHGKIEEWRREQSLLTTLKYRPDLFDEADLLEEDVRFLKKLQADEGRKQHGRSLYLALVHYPVMNKFGKKVAVSLTNLDIHDMSRVSRSYNMAGLFAVTPIEDQKKLAAGLIDHWTQGAGSRANPDRAEALSRVKVVDALADAVSAIEEQTGKKPRIITTSARGAGDTTFSAVRDMLEDDPVLLVFGTGHGLAEEVLQQAEGTLRPLRYMDSYNHLSVRSAVSIIVDRLLGDVY